MDNLVNISWFNEFKNQLVASKVDEFCKAIGIDFEHTFLDSAQFSLLEKNPYRDYIWEIHPHSLIPTNVLHAFHKDYKNYPLLPWEEWLSWEDKPKHNSLYLSRQNEADQIFDGDLNDKEHPKFVLGQPWYCTVEEKLIPRQFIQE